MREVMTATRVLRFVVAWATSAVARSQTLPPFDLPWDPEPLPRG